MKKIVSFLLLACLALPCVAQAEGQEPDKKPAISEEQKEKIRAIFNEQGLKEKGKAVFAARKAYMQAIIAGQDGAKEKGEALRAYEVLLDAQKKTAEALKREGLPPKILMRGMRERKGH